MKKSIRFGPPNLSFFFEDSRGGMPPQIDDRDTHIWASPSSLIVGTLAWVDGDTELMVSTLAEDVPSIQPRFDCVIDTPSRVLQIVTSELEVLMVFDVPELSTRVRVWSNHPKFPDNIFVILG